ncbi:hypothetical protein MD484_g6389, partial [Candolleomyces efflorescens]
MAAAPDSHPPSYSAAAPKYATSPQVVPAGAMPPQGQPVIFVTGEIPATPYGRCAAGIHTPKTNYGVCGIIMAVVLNEYTFL